MNNSQIKNLIWTEKYRPDSIDKFIFPEDFSEEDVKIFKKYCSEKFIDGNYLFFGKGGLGKSTLSKILKKEITLNNKTAFMEVTGRRVDDIDKIKTFYKSRPLNPNIKTKLVIIEESDRLSQKAITELKNIIEDANRYSTYFIAITNFPEKLFKQDRAFVSRFIPKRFSKISPNRVYNFFINFIVPNEGIKITENTETIVKNLIHQLIDFMDYSVRETILFLQGMYNVLETDWTEPEKLNSVIENLISKIQLTGTAPEVEKEIYKKIEKFVEVLSSVYNPKILMIFLYTLTPTQLNSIKIKNKTYEMQLKKLFEIYTDISETLNEKYSDVDFGALFKIIKENNKNPFFAPIIEKYLSTIDYSINPILSVQSFLYELVKVKFDTILTINNLSLEEVKKVWMKEKGDY